MFDRIKSWFKRRPKRSFENPSTPLSDPEWWQFGGTDRSGIRVNEETALTHAPYWAAINVISRDIARLPCLVYRRKDGEERERAPEHPAWRILKYRPNVSTTAFLWKQQAIADVLLWGNHYSLIERDGNGRPTGLERLSPSITTPARSQARALYYEYGPEGQSTPLAAEHVFHIRGLGDGDKGYSVVEQLRSTLSLGMAIHRHGEKFFENGASPRIIFERPLEAPVLGPQGAANILDSFDRKYAGVENHHKAFVAEEGMKVTTLTTSNEDAQFINSLEFNLHEIAAALGIPPHKIGASSRTSFASLEQENLAYAAALDPWLVCFEQEAWEKLLSGNEKQADSHFVEFVREALLRTDLSAQSNYFATAIQNGWMSRNEVRSKLNMNPIPDGTGDIFLVPSNLMASEDLEKEEEPPAPPLSLVPPTPAEEEEETDDEEPDAELEAASRLLSDILRRAANRIAVQARKRRGQSWDFEGYHRPRLLTQVEGVREAVELLSGRELEAEKLIEDFLREARKRLEGPEKIDDLAERLESETWQRTAETGLRDSRRAG